MVDIDNSLLQNLILIAKRYFMLTIITTEISHPLNLGRCPIEQILLVSLRPLRHRGNVE